MQRGILVLVIAVAGTLYLSLRPTQVDNIVPREKLDSLINSDYQEVRPLISADGQTLYFSRRYHPENIGGVKDFQDIWVSNYANGAWSQPTNLGKPINNKKANALCSITNDGKYALLLDAYKQVKTPLAYVNHSTQGWRAPDELIINDLINISSYYDFYYHEQSMVILMAIDNGRGSGEQDLHVSFKIEDGSYSSPKNLGSVINTKKSDFAPFLAADGETLYFASFGHDGLGGSDLFVSRRLDDSWKRWSTPKNLGPGINSEHNENYLSVTGDFSYVYFESYPPGSKDKDLFRAPLPQQFHPENLLPQTTQIELMAADTEPIPNGDSPSPSTPEMKTAQANETVYASPISEVTPPLSNTLAMGSIDTKPKNHFIGNLRTFQYFDKGQIRNKVLKNSYFPNNSYRLTPACLSKLNEITKVLRDNATLQAYIEGYADSSGLDEVNLRLSYLRAQAAAHYLIDQGISVQRLQIIGNGELQPLASNDDEKDGRELNRRVEVTLINPAGVFNRHEVN